MLSDNLKKYREEKNINKTYLAQLSGLSVRTIQLIENNRFNNQKYSTLKSLSKALNVSIEELIK